MPGPKHDWSHWRRVYIRGENGLTLEAISAMKGAPSINMLMKRSAQEGWPELRSEFRQQVSSRLQEIDQDLTLEVRGRHAKIGKAMLGLAALALNQIGEQAKKQPGKPMTVDDLTKLARVGADIERKALGLETLNINFGKLRRPEDLANLSDEELAQLAGLAQGQSE